MTDREVLLEMFNRADLDYCRFDERKNDTLYLLILPPMHLGFHFDEEDGNLIMVEAEKRYDLKYDRKVQ